MVSFKTRQDGRVYREGGLSEKDEAYREYIKLLLNGRRFEDLAPYEKAEIEFKAAEFARGQRAAIAAQARARTYERRSISTSADLEANRRRAEELADRIKKSPRVRRQKMRYNEQLRRFEFVEA